MKISYLWLTTVIAGPQPCVARHQQLSSRPELLFGPEILNWNTRQWVKYDFINIWFPLSECNPSVNGMRQLNWEHREARHPALLPLVRAAVVTWVSSGQSRCVCSTNKLISGFVSLVHTTVFWGTSPEILTSVKSNETNLWFVFLAPLQAIHENLVASKHPWLINQLQLLSPFG